MEHEGIKIVCGGSTSHMVARVLNERLIPVEGELDPEIPPTSKIKGIDLVTEGRLDSPQGGGAFGALCGQ